jgi:hypothetical protein
MTSKECEMACLSCRPQSFVPFRSWVTTTGSPLSRQASGQEAPCNRRATFSGYFAQALEGPRPERTTPKFRGTMDRSIQLKQNVSFCDNSVRRKSGRELPMDGFLWGMQC